MIKANGSYDKEGHIAIFFAYKDGNDVTQSFTISVTPGVLWKLKHVAASFYADELANEPLTEELAKVENARIVLQEEAVVREAERIVFDAQRAQITDIEVKHIEIVNQTNQPTQSGEEKEKTGTSPATKLKEESAVGKKDEPKKKTLGEEVEEYLRLDFPSEKARAYVRELFNRPF